MKRVLVVDCNDSFVYNLVQLLRESTLCTFFNVVNVEEIPFDTIDNYSHILLSPGPGLPSDLPNLHTLLAATHKTHAILGVCLGLQAIGEYFGCGLIRLPYPRHGHESRLRIADKSEPILDGVDNQTIIGRYHSWVIDQKTVPSDVLVTAYDDEGNIMAIKHKHYNVRGVQFHPESVITTHGKVMIENWLKREAENQTKMTKKDLRVVFMGTTDFAVESLKALVENNYNVVGVITAPDKPAGRGHKFQPSAVKEYALSKGLHILQPEKLKDEGFLNQLKCLASDIQVVVAFRMLPEVVWRMPPQGTFNLHASLLPQYRGAAPINWAIINGEKETGVTTFFLKHEIDTGEIIFQERIAIDENDNVETVHNRLMVLGADLVVKTIDAVAERTVRPRPQSCCFIEDEKGLKTAPKIFKETCLIDWDKPAKEIHDFVRGLSPYPAAWTEFEVNGDKLSFKIYETGVVNTKHRHSAGEIVTDNKTTLRVAVQDGFVEILDIQLQGKKRMKARDFLNGFSFKGIVGE